MSKGTFFVFAFLTVFLVLASVSCEQPVLDDPAAPAATGSDALNGTWTFTMDPTTGFSPGSISVTLNYSSEAILPSFRTYTFSGDATVSGGYADFYGAISATALDMPDLPSMNFNLEIIDADGNSMEFDGIISGDSIIGTYEGDDSGNPSGSMDLAAMTGNFTATR